MRTRAARFARPSATSRSRAARRTWSSRRATGAARPRSESCRGSALRRRRPARRIRCFRRIRSRRRLDGLTAPGPADRAKKGPSVVTCKSGAGSARFAPASGDGGSPPEHEGVNMKRLLVPVIALSALVPLLLLSGALSRAGTSHVPSAHAGQLGIDDELTDEQERLLSGFAAFELGKAGNDGSGSDQQPANYFPKGSGDCVNNNSSIIKVNQNCLNLSDTDLQGRAQAQHETSLKVNTYNTNQVVASYNDYRRGDGTCGASWSTDSGRTWNDSTVPNNFVRGNAFNAAREYFEAGGDTSVDWDTKGNAYLACQLFQRGRQIGRA